MFAFYFGCLALIQFQFPDLAGNDGFYHVKLAEELWAQKLGFSFDWLPFTILNADAFVDHHLLYHLLLIPFLPLGLLPAAKMATVVFAAGAFTAIWWLMRTQAVSVAF